MLVSKTINVNINTKFWSQELFQVDDPKCNTNPDSGV